MTNAKRLTEKDKQIILALADNNMNVDATSRATHLHRNTIDYRLFVIFRQTDLDPHNFYDLHKLVQLVKREA